MNITDFIYRNQRILRPIFIALVAVVVAGKTYFIIEDYNKSLAQAKLQGAAEEREAILAWLDGSAKGMISLGRIEEAKTLNALNGMIKANTHYEFRKTIADLDAQHRVAVTP